MSQVTESLTNPARNGLLRPQAQRARRPASRGRWPLGLLGMLLLVTAIEHGLERSRLSLQENVAVCWTYAKLVTRTNAAGKDILCFGDSMVKFGVLPRLLQAHTGRNAYNLALHGGSPPASYYALRHAVGAGARPRMVLADFGWEILAEGPSSASRTYPWQALLSPRESLELAVAAHDADLFARISVSRLLPSVDLRHEVRSEIMEALRGDDENQRSITSLLLRNWRANEGAIVIPKNPEFHDLPLAGPPDRPGDWRCHPVNARFLRSFFELAERYAIRVLWLLPPVSPGTQAKWERSGNEARFERFIQHALDRHDNVVVLDGRHAGFESTVFVDGVHLDRDGATALTCSIAEVLRSLPSVQEPATRRWVPLPKFRQQAGEGLVEDYAQTRTALEDSTREIRR